MGRQKKGSTEDNEGGIKRRGGGNSGDVGRQGKQLLGGGKWEKKGVPRKGTLGWNRRDENITWEKAVGGAPRAQGGE